MNMCHRLVCMKSNRNWPFKSLLLDHFFLYTFHNLRQTKKGRCLAEMCNNSIIGHTSKLASLSSLSTSRASLLEMRAARLINVASEKVVLLLGSMKGSRGKVRKWKHAFGNLSHIVRVWSVWHSKTSRGRVSGSLVLA